MPKEAADVNSIYQEIIANQAIIRESINGACMILFLNLTLMIVTFLYQAWYSHYGNESWTKIPGVPTACALWWIFASEAYRTGSVWSLYRSGEEHDVSALGVFALASLQSTLGYMLCGVILMFGLLRATFIFTPPPIKRYMWLGSGMSAVAFVTISHILDLHGY